MFDDRYEVVLADTKSSKFINFQLRYRVFCLEKGFENPEHFMNGMEHDEHDDNAVHFLVRDRTINQWVAAARLIIGTLDTLPISRVAKLELQDLSPDAMIAEFSRFLILNEYRRPNGHGSSEPEILLGMIRAARQYCLQMGIQQWVFFCRRAISRMLANVGVRVEQIGPACMFRGVRIPNRLHLQSAFISVPKHSSRTHQMLSRPWKSYVRFSDYTIRSTVRSRFPVPQCQ